MQRTKELHSIPMKMNWSLYSKEKLYPNNSFKKKKDFAYLFLERGEGREKERRETSVVIWGPGLKPRHVPWLGFEPSAFQVAGWHSIHGAAPARANSDDENIPCFLAFTIKESLCHIQSWSSISYIDLEHLHFKQRLIDFFQTGFQEFFRIFSKFYNHITKDIYVWTKLIYS